MQRLKFATLIVAMAAAGACDDDGSGEGFNPSDEVQIRAVNAAPGAPAVQVRITDQKIAENLAYGESTGYQAVTGGNQQLRVNADFGDQDDELLEVVAPLTPGLSYSVVLAGGGEDEVVPIVLTDDNAAPPTGQAKLRVLNAARTPEPVDIYVTAPGVDLATTPASFTAIAFASASSYATVPAGAYQVRLTSTGVPDVLTETGVLQLNGGDIRTVVAIESPAGGVPYTTIVLNDSGE